MKFKDIKNEINRISKIKNPQKALEEIIQLNQRIAKPKIRFRKRGNYWYFYEMEIFYNPEVKRSRERITKKYGRILIENYEENKDLIDNLRKKSNIQELKKYLEEY